MIKGTTKLGDDKPGEDGEELMVEEPKEVVLKSMFPTDMQQDIRAHVFVEWLCMASKM